MRVSAEQVGQAWILAVTGEVDIFTAPQLDAPLQEKLAEGNDVVVDLSAVEFLDSSGLGILVKGIKTARQHGGSLRLVITSRRVARPFEVTGLSASLPIFDTRDEALRG
jgi:anti-sigma B factor antagonist